MRIRDWSSDVCPSHLLRTRDIILPERLFPVLDVPGRYTLDPALVLAIIRQESGFDTEAVSRAGARGLMQLMPGTAEQVSRRIGIDYSPASRSEERRVGKECVSPCSSRWLPYH